MIRSTSQHRPIDFVIAWVDGSDPEWRRERDSYLPSQMLSDEGSNAARRFRDWDNLQYWFRGVEKFAPWVRKIHFVTWGHTPGWLNVSHPKINVVCHEDYIPAEYLPTFSSHPIELNLHRIEGLAEQFVYFNDDTFILRPVRNVDFFVKGKPRDCAALNAVSLPRKTKMASQFYNTSVINQHFSKSRVIKTNFLKWFNIKYGTSMLRTLCLMPWPRFTGFAEPHVPTSMLKSTYETVWNEEPEVLRETCSHKFRGVTDVNQWLMRDWQLVTGNFVPRHASFGKHFMKPIDEEIANVITKQKYHLACFNDYGNEETFEAERQLLIDSFNQILPDKCGFEI